jgi:hypothetical protein
MHARVVRKPGGVLSVRCQRWYLVSLVENKRPTLNDGRVTAWATWDGDPKAQHAEGTDGQ